MGTVRSLGAFFLASLLTAQVSVYPLSDVRPGLRGTGYTVFSGDNVESFQVDILGVLANSGPKQSIILGRLSGGPLEKTGVMEGMSGSPVYVDGRLLGAVALGFPLSKEPLAGIRPIEEMFRDPGGQRTLAVNRSIAPWDTRLTRGLPAPRDVLAGNSRLTEIATPVSFSGFTRHTIEQFGPQLRAFGLQPAQGLSGGGDTGDGIGSPERLRPGSMISVLLLRGDMSIGADGTVTHIDGNTIYAFGHRFLSSGDTELPFTRSEVITLAPNLATSFKISSPRELMGAITADYSTAIKGILGRRAAMIPLRITVRGAGGGRHYRLEMVNDRYLAPFLLQMAVFSTIDATERTIGASTVAVHGRVEFQGGEDPVRLDNTYAGDANVALQTSMGLAAPMAYLLQQGFAKLRVKSVSLDIGFIDQRRQWVIDQVWPTRDTVHPGENLEIVVVLSGEDGQEMARRVSYHVREGARPGRLQITVADAAATNLLEYRHLIGRRMRSPAQLIRFLNELRTSSGAYVRLWRPERSFLVQGQTLASPPPSVALVLSRGQSATGGASSTYVSKISEIRIDTGDAVVTGSKTTSVEIKE